MIQKWERDWDKRTLYFFAGTLILGIIEAGRNYDYKRQILNVLSLDTPPPEIEVLLDSAIVASKKEEHIMGLVREKAVRLRNLAYVVDIQVHVKSRHICCTVRELLCGYPVSTGRISTFTI